VIIRPDYPNGVECHWIASDARGQVAVFVTAGTGPIPLAAFGPELPTLDDIGDGVEALDFTSDFRPAAGLCAADIDLARRGLYAYDWSDIHRSGALLNAYELMAAPTQPVALDSLAADLRRFARAVHFAELSFSDAATLDPSAWFECVVGGAQMGCGTWLSPP
jgi:hypothetical protein